jgi:GNAT superfamily N-acetyltransferase
MPEAIVRPGGVNDFDAARAVLEAGYTEYADLLGTDGWKRYLKDIVDLDGRAADSELLIAEHAGEIVACVSYFPPGAKSSYPSDATSERWPFEWAVFRLLAVAPAARRRGLGRLLTQACIDRARRDGAPVVGLHTTAPMATARAMYERMGFEREPRYDFSPAPGFIIEAYRLGL